MSTKSRYSYMDDVEINPLLLCCICNKPFVDPVTADDTRRGCRSCLLHRSPTLVQINEWIVLEMLNSLRVKCLQCGVTNIRRGEFEQHERNSCQRAVVSCSAADIKCPWKGAREQLDTHMAVCVFEPLRPALAEIIMENKQFREKIDQLETFVKQLKGKQ